MRMKDAFLFVAWERSNTFGFLHLTLDSPAQYTGTMVQEYRSNRNVLFACHYHVVWCPN